MEPTNALDAAKAVHNEIAIQQALQERSERITHVALAIALALGILAATLAYVLFPDYRSSFLSTVDPGEVSSSGQAVGMGLIALLLLVIATAPCGVVFALSKLFPLGRSGR